MPKIKVHIQNELSSLGTRRNVLVAGEWGVTFREEKLLCPASIGLIIFEEISVNKPAGFAFDDNGKLTMCGFAVGFLCNR